MACAAQVFSGITQARFDCLVQRAGASGLTINGNQGEAVVDHDFVSAEISWHFDPASQTLILQYLNPSILAGCDIVNGMLNDLVNSCP